MIFAFAYDVLMGFLTPLIMLVMLFYERGRSRWKERLGLWNLHETRPVIWFHGASMGEIKGLLPVIKEVRKAFPEHCLLLTSTSPSGLEAGVEYTDHQHLLPLDCTLWLGFALDNLRIDGAVITETELWPTQLRYMARRGIAGLYVNARISDMTEMRYRYLKVVFKSLFDVFDVILASTEETKERLLQMGAASACISVAGNTKYDGIREVSEQQARQFCEQARLEYGVFTLCLGSIRDGEESVWLPCIKEVMQKEGKFQVIVAPRHREKFEYFARALEREGIEFKRWSDAEKEPADKVSVLLLDTYGKLLEAYAVSPRSFIGATIVDIGGHNPFEAAAQSGAVTVGKYCQNIKQEIADLRKVGGAPLVQSCAEATALLLSDLKDVAAVTEEGERSKSAWAQHRGSTARVLQEIERCLVR